MKILNLFSLIVLFFSTVAHADTITKPHTFTAGQPALASEANANFDTIYNQVNKVGSAITVDDVTGNVGIGTASPGSDLHIVDDDGWATIQMEDTLNGRIGIIGIHNTDGLQIRTQTNDQIMFKINGNIDVLTLTTNGRAGFGISSPNYPLEMLSGAHVTTGGVWTNASSRGFKENIKKLKAEEAYLALRSLEPVTYNYKVEKEEQYVGFIAEDVPDVVAMNDRKSLSPMDMVGVLTKVVQEQDIQIAELRAQNEAVMAYICQTTPSASLCNK